MDRRGTEIMMEKTSSGKEKGSWRKRRRRREEEGNNKQKKMVGKKRTEAIINKSKTIKKQVLIFDGVNTTSEGLRDLGVGGEHSFENRTTYYCRCAQSDIYKMTYKE